MVYAPLAILQSDCMLTTLTLLGTCQPPTANVCRYETEEHLGVCEAMERIANLFLSDSGSIEEAP